jgi:hypothetical protein
LETKREGALKKDAIVASCRSKRFKVATNLIRVVATVRDVTTKKKKKKGAVHQTLSKMICNICACRALAT